MLRTQVIGRLAARFVAGILLLLTGAAIAAAESSSSDRWGFGGELYLWGASIGAKTNGGDDIDISFSDIIKNLDFTIMGTLAANKDKWTLFADLIYMNLSNDESNVRGILGIPIETRVDVGMKSFISTLGGGYRVAETDRTRLSLLAGARYLWLDNELEIRVANRKTKVSDKTNNWDGIVGARGQTDINENWYLTYYADIGTGNSKVTWQALAGVNYRFKKVHVVGGYRYLYWDLDDNDLYDDLDVKGPYAGVKFRF